MIHWPPLITNKDSALKHSYSLPLVHVVLHLLDVWRSYILYSLSYGSQATAQAKYLWIDFWHELLKNYSHLNICKEAICKSTILWAAHSWQQLTWLFLGQMLYWSSSNAMSCSHVAFQRALAVLLSRLLDKDLVDRWQQAGQIWAKLMALRIRWESKKDTGRWELTLWCLMAVTSWA